MPASRLLPPTDGPTPSRFARCACRRKGIGPHPAGRDHWRTNVQFDTHHGDELAKLPDGIDADLRERATTIRWRLNSLIPEFQGPAYDYIVATDELPTYRGLPDGDEMVCKVKLFVPGSRWTYYVVAITDYDGTPVMTGFCLSPHGNDCDEFGDQSLDEMAGVRVLGLPPERDLYFEPKTLREIRSAIADGQTP